MGIFHKEPKNVLQANQICNNLFDSEPTLKYLKEKYQKRCAEFLDKLEADLRVELNKLSEE